MICKIGSAATAASPPEDPAGAACFACAEIVEVIAHDAAISIASRANTFTVTRVFIALLRVARPHFQLLHPRATVVAESVDGPCLFAASALRSRKIALRARLRTPALAPIPHRIPR